MKIMIDQGGFLPERAHGRTLHEAQESALSKALDDLPEAERLQTFVKTHAPGKIYPNTDFFEWHHRLTGSCRIGREKFARDHNIDVEHGRMTPEEFIRLTENAYGGSVIKKLRAYYPAIAGREDG